MDLFRGCGALPLFLRFFLDEEDFFESVADEDPNVLVARLLPASGGKGFLAKSSSSAWSKSAKLSNPSVNWSCASGKSSSNGSLVLRLLITLPPSESLSLPLLSS